MSMSSMIKKLQCERENAIIDTHRKEVGHMSINQRVKEVRQALGMSQAKFAKALSMSNGYIAGIELEHNRVNDRIVKLMGFILNVNEQWLRTGEGCMFDKAPDPLTELASSTFKELKPVYQDYIIKQMELLLEIQNQENK